MCAFIKQLQAKSREGDGFHCGIWEGDELAGVVFWYIHRQNNNAEVGYWLGEWSTGRGLATAATKRALAHHFEEEKLHHVEMQCGTENVRSRAVPERFGFTLEGTRRGSYWITDHFIDHAVYRLSRKRMVVVVRRLTPKQLAG